MGIVTWLTRRTVSLIPKWSIDRALRIILLNMAQDKDDFKGCLDHLYDCIHSSKGSAVLLSRALRAYQRAEEPDPDFTERQVYAALGLEPPKVPMTARPPDIVLEHLVPGKSTKDESYPQESTTR